MSSLQSHNVFPRESKALFGSTLSIGRLPKIADPGVPDFGAMHCSNRHPMSYSHTDAFIEVVLGKYTIILPCVMQCFYPGTMLPTRCYGLSKMAVPGLGAVHCSGKYCTLNRCFHLECLCGWTIMRPLLR